MEERQTARDLDGFRLIAAAGVFILLSLLGPVMDRFWLALLPAAVLFALGTKRVASSAGSRGIRSLQYAAAAVSVSSAALVAAFVAGIAVQGASRVEPQWLIQTVLWAGWLFLGSVIVFGYAARASRAVSRGGALCVSFSMPLSLGVESVVGRVTGLSGLNSVLIDSLAGIWFSAGLGLFGLSLVLIYRRRRSPAARTTPIKAGPAPHPAS